MFGHYYQYQHVYFIVTIYKLKNVQWFFLLQFMCSMFFLLSNRIQFFMSSMQDQR